MADDVLTVADNPMTRLTRDQFIPFLDVLKGGAGAPSYKRIDFSTIFELSAGEQEEDRDYICYPSAITDVTSNKPELPQEIAIYEGNPIYDFMFNEFYELPTGTDCIVPFLLCFGGTGQKAWRGECTISSKVLNTVDGKITFTMKIGGNIEKGTYTLDAETGVPTFVEASDATTTTP